jgi:hypothetical protein
LELREPEVHGSPIIPVRRPVVMDSTPPDSPMQEWRRSPVPLLFVFWVLVLGFSIFLGGFFDTTHNWGSASTAEALLPLEDLEISFTVVREWTRQASTAW